MKQLIKIGDLLREILAFCCVIIESAWIPGLTTIRAAFIAQILNRVRRTDATKVRPHFATFLNRAWELRRCKNKTSHSLICWSINDDFVKNIFAFSSFCDHRFFAVQQKRFLVCSSWITSERAESSVDPVLLKNPSLKVTSHLPLFNHMSLACTVKWKTVKLSAELLSF